jgi:secreted PhoX family phosphatase
VAGTGFTGTAAATMTAADVIPSYAPIQAAPRTGLVYRANWAGKNNAPTGGLTVVSTYATEPTYVLHGRSTGTGLTATGVPATVARRLQQAWHFTKIGTGASQPNTLRFSLTDLNIIPGTTGPLYLLRSAANANFARIGTVADSGVVAGNVVSFAIADTTSAYLTLGFGRAPQLDGPLVAVNSAWKYLADGSNQGAAWQAAAFNDTAWPSGNAELGYGDGDEATVVPYGPSSSAKYTTTYFRQQFTVNSLANFNAVKLRLKRDDGAVVYINGVEVYRSNMPTGAITSSTFAASTVDGAAEVAYFETMLPKTVVTAGLNTIAVEIHQANLTSSDISFNLELLKDQSIILVCNPLPATHLTNFTSVVPGTQQQQLSIPATHTFQKLMQSGDAYSNPADGTVLESNDFTGYVPINGSSTNGYLAVNHEGGSTATSGVSIVDMNFSNTTHTWNVTAKNPVNFAPVLGTWGNCSGGTTPWNTVVTCEENVPAGDSNNDGYLDYGWCVELDPATRSVRDQNADGTPDKLWKLGRMYHENFMILSDRRTAYFGADMSTGFLFKFVATTPGQLGAGNLYVLQLSGALGTAATGIWLPIPNSTPTECNNVIPTAEALGATNFSNIEDVEVGPHDGRIYFTSKTNSRVYRFLDASNAALTVSGFEEFVGGQDYPITYDTGTAAESWREGNDNLTFDTEGNLYVLQDGGRNHIWLVKPCHTAANPQVQLFAVTPTGCEPTGMTLSPDNRFMFLSFQHPSSTNTQATTDAAGQSVVFNRSTTVVIARREVLGPQAVVTAAATARATSPVTLFPNPVSDQVSVQLDHDRAESASLQIISSIGRRVLERPISLKAGQNQVQLSVGTFAPGQYTLLIKTASGTISRSFIKL